MSGFSWEDLGSSIANVAPMLGTALLGAPGAAVGSLLASAFGTENNPEAISKAIEADPESQIKLIKIQTEHETELTRMILAAETAQLTQVNGTMRAEYGQDDKYVKRWRPTFGYAVCLTWVVQGLSIIVGTLWAIIAEPDQADLIIEAIGTMMGALGLQWSVALSVLGVSVAKRSDDKKLAAGKEVPAGLLASIAQRLGSKNG